MQPLEVLCVFQARFILIRETDAERDRQESIHAQKMKKKREQNAKGGSSKNIKNKRISKTTSNYIYIYMDGWMDGWMDGCEY